MGRSRREPEQHLLGAEHPVLRLRAERTKGKRRGRLVTLWPQAADALERYLHERDITSEHERVFTTDDSKPLFR